MLRESGISRSGRATVIETKPHDVTAFWVGRRGSRGIESQETYRKGYVDLLCARTGSAGFPYGEETGMAGFLPIVFCPQRKEGLNSSAVGVKLNIFLKGGIFYVS